MHRLVLGTAAGLALAALVASPAGAQTATVNGRFSAFANTVIDLSTSNGLDPVVTATIAKGRRRHVLVVDATVITPHQGATILGIVPSVNGIGMLPQSAVNLDCPAVPSSLACSLSGHWWLDLDAAELANPGALINQPLVVGIVAVQNDPESEASVSLRARLQKK